MHSCAKRPLFGLWKKPLLVRSRAAATVCPSCVSPNYSYSVCFTHSSPWLFAAAFALVAAADVIVRVPPNLIQAIRTKYAGKGYFASDNSTDLVIGSVKIDFEDTPSTWEPVSAVLMSEELAANTPSFGFIRANNIVPPSAFRRVEAWMAYVWEQARPPAMILYGGAVAGGYQTGRNRDVSAGGTACPVVQTTQNDANVLLDILQMNGGLLNVTVTLGPENPYASRRAGAVYIFLSVVLCLAAIASLSISVTSLVYRGVRRNLPTICLILDIVGATLRIFFATDPYAGRWIPPSIIETLFTAHIPLFVGSTILIAMFWHELATHASVEIAGGLTKLKIPALIVLTVLFSLEAVSAAFRAAKTANILFIVLINAIYYIVVIVLMIIYYVYVSVKVFSFLSSKSALRTHDKILRDVRPLSSALDPFLTIPSSCSFPAELSLLFAAVLCF